MIASGDVTMDQSAARLLVAKGAVNMDQGGSVFTAANQVNMQNSGTVFLLARKIEGDVNTVFGQRESILFGAVAGAVAGTIMMLANLARRRRK